MKRQPVMISLALALSLFLGGCEVVFTHAPAGKLRSDKTLLGSWINQEKDKEATTLKFDKGTGEEIKISFLPANQDERNPVFTARLLITGNRSYMILNPTNEDRDKGFLLARYEIRSDELVIWLPNSERFKTLIQQKRILGTAESMGAVVTDSPDNLAKLLESKDSEDAFEIFGRFRRVKG
jgi:hypothetical protein